MAKEKSAASGSIWRELFLHTGLYKRSQGRVVRQVTFAALAVTFILGCWELQSYLSTFRSNLMEFVIPGGILLLGLWVSFRLVNMPRFADFLIAVEAEMNKVSWPSRPELIRASIVVIFVIFFLAALLFSYDVIWKLFFTWIGVLHRPPEV